MSIDKPRVKKSVAGKAHTWTSQESRVTVNGSSATVTTLTTMMSSGSVVAR